MEPRDLDLGKFPLQINPPGGGGISSKHPSSPLGNVTVVMADGAVLPVSDNLPPDVLQSLLSRNGNEFLPPEWYDRTYQQVPDHH